MESTELYVKYQELYNRTLKYKPIYEQEAIGKVVKEIYTLSHESSNTWKVVVFTDKTALYLEDSYVITHFSIVTTCTLRNSHKVDSWLTDLGQVLYESNLLNNEFIEELFEAAKAWKNEWLIKEKQEKINKLKEELKELESDESLYCF